MFNNRSSKRNLTMKFLSFEHHLMHSCSEAQYFPQQLDLLGGEQKRGHEPIVLGNGPSILMFLKKVV